MIFSLSTIGESANTQRCNRCVCYGKMSTTSFQRHHSGCACDPLLLGRKSARQSIRGDVLPYARCDTAVRVSYTWYIVPSSCLQQRERSRETLLASAHDSPHERDAVNAAASLGPLIVSGGGRQCRQQGVEGCRLLAACCVLCVYSCTPCYEYTRDAMHDTSMFENLRTVCRVI